MNRFLVVVDMQNDFIDGSLGTAEARGILPSVIETVKSFCGRVVFTRDTHRANYLESREGKALPVEHCIEGTDGWQIQSELEALRVNIGAPVINKPTFGSVELPALVAKAADGDDFSVELIGLCTDICVVSNTLLLKAHFPETEISVDASCCAGVTPATHAAALTTMEMCQIRVTR